MLRSWGRDHHWIPLWEMTTATGESLDRNSTGVGFPILAPDDMMVEPCPVTVDTAHASGEMNISCMSPAGGLRVFFCRGHRMAMKAGLRACIGMQIEDDPVLGIESGFRSQTGRIKEPCSNEGGKV